MANRPQWKTSPDYASYDETRERIIVAAAEVIGSVGLDKLRLDEVAKQAGCVRQTLYRYFNSKKDLAAAVLMYFTVISAREVADRVADIDDPESRLVEVVFYAAKNLSSNPKFRIFADARNSRIYDGLSLISLPEVLGAAGLGVDNPIAELARKEGSTRELYLWIAMQAIALANFGLVSEDEEKTRKFIRNMLVRGPLHEQIAH